MVGRLDSGRDVMLLLAGYAVWGVCASAVLLADVGWRA
jgi:hypothetical protein